MAEVSLAYWVGQILGPRMDGGARGRSVSVCVARLISSIQGRSYYFLLSRSVFVAYLS